MEQDKYDFGMIGLGTMGRNLVYNMSDNGFSVAGFDKSSDQVATLQKESAGKRIIATTVLKDFMESLSLPRVILFLVPAGPIVDAVINELKPFLSDNDLLMDCGNSHFTDTDTRTQALAKENIHFMGAGVSGGESGARYGPSIMPGGNRDAYNRVAPMLEAIAAKVNGEPCVNYMGNGSAGHYVKMVHNGIEYGIMQLITESYHFMKKALGLNNDELKEVYSKWNTGIIQSFLVEITADIFGQHDDLTPDNRLVDMILDSAGQKGTGAWTSEDAMSLQIPLPTIDTAVSVRDLSALKKDRVLAEQMAASSKNKKEPAALNKDELINAWEQALYFAMINTYSQGFSLLNRASSEYKYDLKLAEIATIWRGGCIIRAAMLEDIRVAFTTNPGLSSMLLDPGFLSKATQSRQHSVICIKRAINEGIPVPALMSSLAYFDGYCSGWLPANLLQAQRDYFGAHTYERNDRPGTFHIHWNQTNK